MRRSFSFSSFSTCSGVVHDHRTRRAYDASVIEASRSAAATFGSSEVAVELALELEVGVLAPPSRLATGCGRSQARAMAASESARLLGRFFKSANLAAAMRGATRALFLLALALMACTRRDAPPSPALADA